jgi:hypothetical protein
VTPRSGLAARAGPVGDADALLDRLGEAIRGRVDSRLAAETRLASFAFGESPSTPPSGPPEAAATDWQYFTTRALAAVAEPDAFPILEALRGDGLPLPSLERLVSPLGRDRLAVADRIGDLAAAGLVGRELESDIVALTPLGEALLGLIDEISTRARGDRQ